MALLIPSLKEIETWRVAPEEGELHLLRFLKNFLDDSFEVYFNPFMNGDRPDIVVMKKGQGVLIIEVKDYELRHYELDERKNWKVLRREGEFPIKSPISQVLKYKDNLFELHIERLLEEKIRDIRSFNMVSCAVYFHNATSDQLKEFLVTPYENDWKYQKFLKYNIDLIGRDDLNNDFFNSLLRRRYMISDRPSVFFKDQIYSSFKRFLKPPLHLREEGQYFHYSPNQQKIVYDDYKIQSKLVKGVVGSGKTTVLAARAVQNYKKFRQPILILTYNITLKNFIHDKLSKVREEFPWEMFVISNYHFFITNELNNLQIPVIVPDGFEGLTVEEKKEYFETTYYSNKALFSQRRDEIPKYGSILIDEIQDYKRAWMEIIKDNFLAEGGEYILFGDVKQNIYNNEVANKDLVTNIGSEGSVRHLKTCYRSDAKIKDLAVSYQKAYFENKYTIDTFNDDPSDLEFPFEREGHVNYIYLPQANNISSLYTIIHQNAINKGIAPNDITILSQTIHFLRDFDSYYRYRSNERTNTMFETNEMIYKMAFDFLGNSNEQWLREGISLLKRERDSRRNNAYNQLAVLFTIMDLCIQHPGAFDIKLEFFCKKYNTNIIEFKKWFEKFKVSISEFKKKMGTSLMARKQESIRNNKKIHFFMNSGTLKLSTVHSFKGWESELLFLIIEKKYDTYTEFQNSFDEIIYTGLTRSRTNLVILNYGNTDYHEQLKNLVKQVNES